MMTKTLLSLMSIYLAVVACSGSDSDQNSNKSAEPAAVSSKVDFPDELNISFDGERLERGDTLVSKFYDEDVLETIYIDFDQKLLDQNYPSRTEIEARLIYKHLVYDSVGVKFRGFTSYSLAGERRSFSADLGWAINDQDIDRYNNLNLKLNNGFEDSSAMREVLFSSLAQSNIPAAKANLVKLVVNGESYGVYSNVKKLLKDHVKEWFFDNDATRWRAEVEDTATEFPGPPAACPDSPNCPNAPDLPENLDFVDLFAGRSSLNNLYPSGSNYETEYELRNSDVDDLWQNLANAAFTLDTANRDGFFDELGQYSE